MLLEDGRLIGVRDIGSLGRVLQIRAPAIARQARPGQFVSMRSGDSFEPLLRRPYSFLRIERDAGEIEILVGAPGSGEWIVSRRPGDTLELRGPFGTPFAIRRSTKNLLLVASGTGIAPMRVIAEQEAPRRNVTLLFGGRTIHHLWPATLLPAGVEYVTTTEDGSFGVKGRLTDALPDLLAWADQVLAAGSWSMLAALGRVRDEAKRASAVYPGREAMLDAEIAVEQHIVCAMGVCRGCVIVTKSGNARVCREGPVFALGEIAFEQGEPATAGAHA